MGRRRLAAVVALAVVTPLGLAACSTPQDAAPTTSPLTAPATTVASSTTATTTTTSTVAPTTTPASTTPTSLPLATTTTSPPRDGAPTAAEQAALDDFASAAAAQRPGKIRAISATVLRGDTAIGGYHTGVTGAGDALADDAPFRLASLSKLLTATVVLQLVDEGSLSLDASLGDAWPAPTPAMDPQVRTLTVRQLLQHISGFGPFRPQFFGEEATDWHTNALLGLRTPPALVPNTVFRYSNMNYVVLASLAEAITDEPIEQLVEERVARPLGLMSLRMDSDTAPSDLLGPAYVLKPERRYIEALGPAGAWVASSADVARVLAALRPGATQPLLPADLVTQMHAPGPHLPKGEDWAYGLGLMIGHGWVGHTGTIEDVATVAITLANGYTVTILTASSGLPEGEALLEVFALPLLELAVLPTVGSPSG